MVLLVVLSAFIHAAWNLSAKRVSGDLGVLWVGQVMGAIAVLPLAVWFYEPAPLSLRALGHVAFTAVIQVVYFGTMSRAYRIGDLSVVYPIARGCGVAGAALISGFVLVEAITPFGAAGIASVCAGCFVLGTAGKGRGHVGYALLLGVTLAVSSTNDKLAVEVLHPVVYIFLMYGLSSIVIAPFVPKEKRTAWRVILRQHWRHAALIGVGSLFGYLIILYAFQLGPLGYVVALREMSVVLGACASFLLLKEAITRRKIVGIALITTGLVLIRLA